MNLRRNKIDYTTTLSADDVGGYIALVLNRKKNEESRDVARIVYWDADGQFVLEATHAEIPLDVMEQFIAEAKTSIKYK